MHASLVHIDDIDPEWEVAHKIRAIAFDDRTPALTDLADLKIKHHADYQKLLLTLRLLAEKPSVENSNHVKRGQTQKDIYEARGGQARLFFFYLPPQNTVVVCTNIYFKTSSNRREQNRAFEKAETLRKRFLEARWRLGSL